MSQCAGCNRPFESRRRGSHRRYCSDKCKQAVYRVRNNVRGDTAVTNLPPLYDQDDTVTLYHSDNTVLLPLLAPHRVDLALTDPPYNVANADIRLQGGAVRMVRDFGAWDKQGWHPAALLAPVARLLRPGGSLIAFTSPQLLSWYTLAAALPLRGSIIWLKTNPAMQFRPGYMKCVEHIVWLAQPGAPAIWNGDGVTRNVFAYPIVQGREHTAHPTQKPLRLLKDLVRLHNNAGDRILDPFAGSGTTLWASQDLGRKAVGIEMDERHCAIAAQRLAQGVFTFDDVA
ncbi:MAG: site-specific DNA-methyltransferase [Chloroflexales bacterium]|nr:site-specific DNA-methyltransferase [Chloroflexales bacterium]